MGVEIPPGLRGFDSYEVTLGDELRGERASRGKSLLDVQRELRIKADYIAAIESSNASAFPHAGFAAGYVRAYARYLRLDEETIYRRFCAESGFGGVAPTEELQPRAARREEPEPPLRAAAPAAGLRHAASRHAAADRAVSGPRFAPRGGGAREAAVALRGLGSVAALGLVVAALGYGGWSLLKDIQRLGFAPIPTAPEVLVVAPDFAAPAEAAPAAAEAAAPDPARATLAALYAAQEAPPALAPRDGPISSIDPRRAGIYATPEAPEEAPAAAASDTSAPLDETALLAEAAVPGAVPEAGPSAAEIRGIDVLALEEAWVRIRDGERRVLFTGILGAGERFSLPADAAEPELRAGNAGAVYILLDGAAYGPLGSGPEVARSVALKAEAVRAAYPRAAGVAAEIPARTSAAAPAEGDVALRAD